MSRNIFREAKRLISQHFERRYWYEWRKVPHYWYNDETKKYEDSSYPKNAKTIINSTWEGEYDLWTAMLLKLDHMFFNLRKYGAEKDYYFFSNDIETYGSDKDKEFILKSSLRKHFKKENTLFLFNIHTSDASLSENGLIHFNIKLDNDKLILYAEYNKEIPQNKIPKKKKLYTLLGFEKDDKGKSNIKWEFAKQYKTYTTDEVYTWNRLANEDIADFILDRVAINFDKVVVGYLKTLGSKIKWNKDEYFDVQKILIELLDTSLELYVDDKSKLSKELKKHAIGNFVKCRDILHLRHLIKNLLKISDTDDKYYSMWRNVEDDEERAKKLKEAEQLYLNDREEAYKKVMSFMCDKSPRWWD